MSAPHSGVGQSPAEFPADVYEQRAERFDGEAAARSGAVRLFGRMRLALFAAAVSGAWLLIAAGRTPTAWALLGGAAIAFAVLVARHRAARRRMRRAELMADFNREGIARVERRWDALRPVPDLAAAPEQDPLRDHDYAADLDLHGHASLLHLIGACGTPLGRKTLQEWLMSAADPDTAALRQEAVREMADAMDFRDRLAAEARMAFPPQRAERAGAGHREVPSAEDPGRATIAATDADAGAAHPEPTSADGFLRWAEGDPWLPGHPWLRFFGFLLPPVNLAAIALYALGVVSTPALAWPLLISTLVLAPRWRAIHRVFAEADDGRSGVRRYTPLLRHIRRAAPESRCAAAIRERIGTGPRAAPEEIAALRRLLDMADLRRSPLFHVPLALVLHWDVHVLAALERWKVRSGPCVRDWLDAVGEAEALAALAALAADHPGWTMPVLDPAAGTVRARALGHPLLPPGTCVRNDIEIGPANSFLLVTGSNMSGKSTLLRAVGLNAVLAQAGGPVCAAELRMPPLRIVTSMRVDDSLAEGVSYFMAGLQRLKRVVDAARAPTDPCRPADRVPHPGSAPPSGVPGGAPARAIYLLDEILRGTNSAERRIASRTVLRQLLDTGAVGAVTTHDLSLADADDLLARAVAVHFTESVGAGTEGLTFDYRLRDGIATSTNALKLLEMAGLGEAG